MDKIKKIIIGCIVFTFLICSQNHNVVFAQGLSDEDYQYPVQPGTEEWFSLSLDERISASHVDISVAQNMTTRALVKATIDYPFIGNIYAYDLVEEGINKVQEYCTTLEVLLARQDAYKYLSIYVETEQEQSCKYFVACRIKEYIEDRIISSKYVISPITKGRADTVNSPKGYPIRVYRNCTWKNGDKSLKEAQESEYNFTRLYRLKKLRDVTPLYNCHSYAWYSQRTTNNVWMDDPSQYIREGSYTKSTGKAGDKVLYRYNGGGISHSAIVKNNSTVVSKWGALGLYEHNVLECPYYMEDGAKTIEYWKKN